MLNSRGVLGLIGSIAGSITGALSIFLLIRRYFEFGLSNIVALITEYYIGVVDKIFKPIEHIYLYIINVFDVDFNESWKDVSLIFIILCFSAYKVILSKIVDLDRRKTVKFVFVALFFTNSITNLIGSSIAITLLNYKTIFTEFKIAYIFDVIVFSLNLSIFTAAIATASIYWRFSIDEPIGGKANSTAEALPFLGRLLVQLSYVVLGILTFSLLNVLS